MRISNLPNVIFIMGLFVSTVYSRDEDMTALNLVQARKAAQQYKRQLNGIDPVLVATVRSGTTGPLIDQVVATVVSEVDESLAPGGSLAPAASEVHRVLGVDSPERTTLRGKVKTAIGESKPEAEHLDGPIGFPVLIRTTDAVRKSALTAVDNTVRTFASDSRALVVASDTGGSVESAVEMLTSGLTGIIVPTAGSVVVGVRQTTVRERETVTLEAVVMSGSSASPLHTGADRVARGVPRLTDAEEFTGAPIAGDARLARKGTGKPHPKASASVQSQSRLHAQSVVDEDTGSLGEHERTRLVVNDDARFSGTHYQSLSEGDKKQKKSTKSQAPKEDEGCPCCVIS